MSDLSPRARALVDAARAGGGATPEDRERVFASVAAKVGIAAAGAAVVSGASTAAAVAKSAPVIAAGSKLTIVFVVLTSVSVAAAGASVYVYARTHEAAAHRAPVTRVRARTLASPPPVASIDAPASNTVPVLSVAAEPAPAPVAPVNGRRSTPTAHRPSPRSPSTASVPTAGEPSSAAPPASATTNTLAEELALIGGARGAIRSHDGRAALALLDEFAARFPGGMLREERDATYVLALCEAHRIDEARSAARAFLADHPHSPHAARVRASCAGDTP